MYATLQKTPVLKSTGPRARAMQKTPVPTTVTAAADIDQNN
jgi:hypothetical protein